MIAFPNRATRTAFSGLGLRRPGVAKDDPVGRPRHQVVKGIPWMCFCCDLRWRQGQKRGGLKQHRLCWIVIKSFLPEVSISLANKSRTSLTDYAAKIAKPAAWATIGRPAFFFSRPAASIPAAHAPRVWRPGPRPGRPPAAKTSAFK